MKRGVWHQCGDKSQRLVREQLELGMGVGVIISPRDLGCSNAKAYASQYRELGADVLLDHQFFIPDFTNSLCASYPTAEYRRDVPALCKLSEQDLTDFEEKLRADHEGLEATAVIAPAVIYEAGRPDLTQLNSRLFSAAKSVASHLKIPVYATVVLGRSVTSSDQTLQTTLSEATALNADGWYFGFEFEEERIPSSPDAVGRCALAGLTLACTGKPVLHAYAGPMGLLSLGFGATGVGVGHSQNLWKFSRDRWTPPTGQGGGGDAPARYFSRALWGTLVYPDEWAQLTPALQNQVLSASPFSPANSGVSWTRWNANKHLVFVLAEQYSSMTSELDARKNVAAAITILKEAVNLHAQIQQGSINLNDRTNSYQLNWQLALEDLLKNHEADFDFLDLATQ